MPSRVTAFWAEPFSLREAAAVGISRGELRALVRDGRLRRVLRGVYVDQAVPDGIELRARALAKVIQPETVVCLRTAAWFWGVEVLAMGAHRVVPPVDLMGPAGSSAPRRQAVSGSTGPLGCDDIVVLFGVRVTGLIRTAADLARLLARPDALASLDALFRATGLPREQVEEALGAFTGYRGVVQARELVGLADPRAESPMESRTRLRAIDAGFPPFEPQVKVFDEAGTFVARLDLGRRRERKGVEYDGDAAHSSRADQAHDVRRRRRVEDCGWDLAVVTAEQVLGRGLAFEHGIAELLACDFRLTRNHPNRGGWDARRHSAA